ncbi:MAG: DegT/DnrJ/EryC1/StrS family aminotransferase [Candidatus Hydrogenedentes bacterium]|nr:DegT/DnrJ/EryC1/StrS family aminotransferase [Candidatus Hydrogenedentota bacterium]
MAKVGEDVKLAICGGPKCVTADPTDRWAMIPAGEVKAAIGALLEEGKITIADGSGVVGEFEEGFKALVGTRYALAMNSGTATLHSAYFAAGVSPGTEVLAPSYTWHASITPILHCSATPVFCDIEPDTLTIDPRDMERKITPKTRAVCVVHVWGNVADMDRIMALARKHKLAVIEDASHAHGAKYKGRPVGGIGDIGCFSLQGVKAVSGGEAGVATTNDPVLFDRMVLLGHFGRGPKRQGAGTFDSIGDMSLGAKYRPHPFAIALANCQLKRLTELNRLRARNYAVLNELLRDVPGIETFEPRPGCERGGYLEFKFGVAREIADQAPLEKIEAALQAEGAPVQKDRYSSFNYTYGLLHTAPLFTTFDRASLGGCFYDPKSYTGKPVTPVKLPVTEDVCTRLLGTYAFADVSPEYLKQIGNAFRKVMTHLEQV